MAHACLPHRAFCVAVRTHLVLLHQQLGLLHEADAVIVRFFPVNFLRLEVSTRLSWADSDLEEGLVPAGKKQNMVLRVLLPKERARERRRGKWKVSRSLWEARYRDRKNEG